MRTLIFMLPEFKNRFEEQVELDFFRSIIDALNKATDVYDAADKLHKLFAKKLVNRNIEFDYGVTSDGIIVKYGEHIVLLTECYTLDYLNSDY